MTDERFIEEEVECPHKYDATGGVIKHLCGLGYSLTIYGNAEQGYHVDSYNRKKPREQRECLGYGYDLNVALTDLVEKQNNLEVEE